MRIKFVSQPEGADYLAAPLFGNRWTGATDALDEALDRSLSSASTGLAFDAEPGSCVDLVICKNEITRIGLFGLPDEPEPAVTESYAANAVKIAAGHGARRVTILADTLDPVSLAGGALLASYRFDLYRQHWLAAHPKKKFAVEEVAIVSADPDMAAQNWARKRGPFEGANWARDLINAPPNVLTPSRFADECAKLQELEVSVRVLDEADMQRLGMNALLGVGLGSRQESKLAVLEWMGAGPGDPITAFVGKGVTFDTGGISIKPAMSMEDMKCDMGGAAAIVGAMHAIACRKANANVIGVLALAENMPDGLAQRPSDIVKSMSGQMIEIVNTDAEGRLMLADALTWVQQEYSPERIVDLATLTGAMIISLGHLHAGLFSNNDGLADALCTAGKSVGETLWRMPLDPAYDRLMDSDFADVKNAYVKNSGAITAAQFLQRFVRPEVAWAHLDIAGVATRPIGDDPRFPNWATGWGPKLLDQFISNLEAS